MDLSSVDSVFFLPGEKPSFLENHGDGNLSSQGEFYNLSKANAQDAVTTEKFSGVLTAAALFPSHEIQRLCSQRGHQKDDSGPYGCFLPCPKKSWLPAVLRPDTRWGQEELPRIFSDTLGNGKKPKPTPVFNYD